MLMSVARDDLDGAANDLNWFDPDTGETVVYNLGDMAWIISATGE